MTQPIIDSHVHFWDPNHLNYDWLADLPAINKPFLPADLVAQAGDLNVEQVVFVQAGGDPAEWLQEVEWVTQLAQAEPRIAGIVALAPLELVDEARVALRELGQRPLVKGVRRLIQSEPLGFCLQPDFVAGVQALAAYDLSFDICILHHQLGDVLQLVAQCPQVRFVLDHLGKPDAKTPLFEPWREQITVLAQFPNVCCKLSGLVTEAHHRAWTRKGIRPFIQHIIHSFGTERIMYGGDWPVSLLAATYREWIETLRWATADLTPAEQHKLFYENARVFYGL
jgi:L-fuconolactonase